MNIDFHYYGTYVAARLAGYSFSDAQILAHSAQYVDDSENSSLKDSKGNYYIKDFIPIPTVHSFTELGLRNYWWTEQFADEIERVWPIFHFLPGNYDKNGKYVKAYEGAVKDSGNIVKWAFDDEAKEQFKLMCLPNSILVEKMINDLLLRNSIHEIGLRMHTLADTWAHMYYAGIPAWFINNVYEGVVPSPVVPSVYYNSLAYLGHLMNWHNPDYPFLTFLSRPQWSKNQISKNNQSDFLLALKQMVEAMSCIRENREFKIGVYKTIDAANEKVIKEILATVQVDQSETWKKRIKDIKVNGKSLEVPNEYNSNKWLDDYKVSPNTTKDYYKFNLAATYHLKFVKDALKEHRIFLDNVPTKRIAKVKIQQKSDLKYISKAIYSSYPWPAPYPTLATKAVELNFILPNDKGLCCGTNIKIKTTETGNDFGEKVYLGAWGSPSLYYNIKDYNIFKQKWHLEQDGIPAGQPIDTTKPVLIKNAHYEEKPYLASYFWLNKQYLTTDSKKHYWNLNVSKPEDQTVGFVVMLDTSGSMASAIPMVKINTKAFLDQAKKGDQFGVNQFSDDAKWVYPKNSKIVPVTSYPSAEVVAAKNEIEKIGAQNMTNIGAAISLGNEMIKGATTDTRAFVLLSDGDHNKGTKPNTVLESTPPIYIAGLGSFVSKEYFENMLAKNTNSRYYHSPNALGMMKIFNEIRGMAPNSLLTSNEVNQFSGSNYKVIETNVVTDSGEVQITVVWSDKLFKYTDSYPSGYNFNVILYDPQGRKTSHKPEIVDGGYCIFNLKDAIQGKWSILLQYALFGSLKAHCTTGVVQFGSTAKIVLNIPNTIALGKSLPVQVSLTDDSVPMENVNIHARITRPLISIDNALKKYEDVLKDIHVSDGLMSEKMGEDEARLHVYREQQMPSGDILGTASLFQPLFLSADGLYVHQFEDTHEAGSYTIEVIVSGINRVTGKPVSASQRRSVLVG